MAEVRALRRWLRVAAVWATAATLIAGFALYVADDTRSGGTEAASTAERRIIDLGRTLDRRLDAFESRLRGVPRAADVQRLEGRLETTERRAAGADDAAGRAGDRTEDLERRMDALSRRVNDATETTRGAP